MDSKIVLNPPSREELELIHTELGVNKSKLENSLKLLKEWLRCESHLPNDIDENLLLTFIRGCKGALEKAKLKLEKYLVAKTKLTYLFYREPVVDEDFACYLTHRCIFVSANYTKEGNRIIIVRIPSSDATHFDYVKMARYIILIFDFLLHYDITAGYEFIYDAENVSGQILSKVNLTVAKHLFDIAYNIFPIRTKSIFVLNPNTVFEVLMTLARVIMPKKIKERITYGKLEDVIKRYSAECLPVEYRGTDRSADDLGDEYLNLLKMNGDWIERIGQVKLSGPLPEHKKKLYSFEEYNMEGSFRNLNID